MLLGYYVLDNTAGLCQCADLSFCGCFWCTFFACWFWTTPLSFLICLIPDCHTGLQFPVYGPPPTGYNPEAWQTGPPPDYQYPPGYAPPPPGNFAVPGPGVLPTQYPRQQSWVAREPVVGVAAASAGPATTTPPQEQDMKPAKAADV